MEETAEERVKRFGISIPYEEYFVYVWPEFMEMFDEHLRNTVEPFKYDNISVCPVEILKKCEPDRYSHAVEAYAVDLIYNKMMPQEMFERIEITSVDIKELAGLQAYP